MRIGALLLPTDSWPETVIRARHIEALGYDHLWVYDHLAWRRYHERPWHGIYPWIAGVAGATDRIRLGTMVANPNIRHPLTLAKDVMTIDHISSGRLTFGIGAGGTGVDARILGQQPLTPGQRADRLIEFVDLFDGLLRGETTDWAGDYYSVVDARVVPGCIQKPRVPIAVAATGPRLLRYAAERADAWITYGHPRDLTPEGTVKIVAEQLERLDQACADIGRHPDSIDRIYLIGNTDARPLRSVEAFGEFMEQYAGLGFTDLVFHHPRSDDPVWDEPDSIVDEIAAQFLGR
jgi:alkanesulfonate monooxygenase SsuD/methylene tetrahydromethanopterin reductase-like flavin-dependent oxidoreductase (luciferase family)